MSNGPTNVKLLKRGDLVIKLGDRPKNVYLVASGKISILQSRTGENVEIFHVGDSQCLGEDLIYSPTGSSGEIAVAVKDSRVVEIPAAALKELIEKAPGVSKAFLKGLLERVKATSATLKDINVQKNQTPCPADSTARIFGVILHSAKATSKMVNSCLEADWKEFKGFATGIFEESPNRLEEAINILVKLEFAELQLEVNGEISKIRFKDLVSVENFFELYFSFHFKGGHGDMLKTNEKSARITHEFLKISEEYIPDRGGIVSMPFKKTIDTLKDAFGGRFEADQLFGLQNKGLMIKLTPSDAGGVLSFYKEEFLKMLINWKFLREVELWNERGFVDMTPPSEVKPKEQEVKDTKNSKKSAQTAEEELKPSKQKESLHAALLQSPRIVNPPANAVVQFRKQDFLYKMGEAADRVFLLQSGLVSLLALKGEQSFEVSQATGPQLIGEEALSGATHWTLSAVAINDTEALELSVQQANALVETFPGTLKLLVKSLLKKQKSVSADVMVSKTSNLTKEPCPPEAIPKLFAVIYHAAISTATNKKGRLTVVWPAYRKYCHWGLLESPNRLELTLQLLSKLGHVDLEYVKSDTDPEAPDELGFVHFNNIEVLQGFYKYYFSLKGISIEDALKKPPAPEDTQTHTHHAILREIQTWNANGKLEGVPAIEALKEAAAAAAA